MAADCSERLMWDTDRGNIMQQLHEFRCRTSSMPPLHINAPRRNVKGKIISELLQIYLLSLACFCCITKSFIAGANLVKLST